MKKIIKIVAVLAVFHFFYSATSVLAQAGRIVSTAQFEGWMEELSNWGRWGEEDQLGTINLITPEKSLEALMLVEEGVSVSMARDLESEAAIDNFDPFEHRMLTTGLDDGDSASDYIGIQQHGLTHTHLDALGHYFHKGKMYNGFSREEVTEEGVMISSILNMKTGIITRGILVDVPVVRGVDYLEPGEAVYPEDFEAWEEMTGITIGSGDAVFVRTGRWLRREELGPWGFDEGLAGMHASVAVWLHERDVALLGSDFATEQFPPEAVGERAPFHKLTIVSMGLPLFDACDLEDISREAAARNRYEFLLTVAPLAIPRGTGSPVNPIATF